MLSNFKSVEENKEYLKNAIGVNRSKQIDWINSIGKKIEYEYDMRGTYSKGVFKIRKYENGYVYFEGYEKGVKIGNLIRCRLGGILGFISSEFKYEIGDIINCLTIIDRDRLNKKGKKWKCYKYKCNKCGNEDWIGEYSLKDGSGCNACCSNPKKAVLGINSIWDKARWMMDLGLSEEDAKTHTPGSNDKVKVRCPDCGNIKEIAPAKIQQTHSIGCSCGDGISYPEKLMESVLIQLNIDYERQYRIDKFRYDFYLSEHNTVIEVHGEQHGQFIKNGELTLVERTKGFTYSKRDEIKNDADKCWTAYKNGVENYITVDCYISELEYIRLNILDSELNELLDLNKIDWIKCGEYALKNKVKEVCEYYHLGISTADLAKEFNMGRTSIINYLKSGAKLGWCTYDAKEEMRRSGRFSGKLYGGYNRKQVSQFTLEGEFIKKYDSAREAARKTGIDYGNISKCCNGRYKTAGGFIWKYV